MADNVVGMTRAQAIAEVRRLTRYKNAEATPSADIQRQLDQFLQYLYVLLDRRGMAAKWWSKKDSMTESAGSAAVVFPVDYYKWKSFYDRTAGRPIRYVIEQWNEELDGHLRDLPRGEPVHAIEILDVDPATANAVRDGTIYPTPSASVTPDIEIYYQRFPLAPDDDAKFYDVPVHLHHLTTLGAAMFMSISNDPAYRKFKAQVDEQAQAVLGFEIGFRREGARRVS